MDVRTEQADEQSLETLPRPADSPHGMRNEAIADTEKAQQYACKLALLCRRLSV
jgi:hypothetical protein